MNLFVYGTLQEQSALEDLIERKVTVKPKSAQITDYEKKDTPFGYPIILAKEGCRVKGFLWSELEADDLSKLDSYEDCDGKPPLYYRVEEEVEVDGTRVKACFYVGNLAYWKNYL